MPTSDYLRNAIVPKGFYYVQVLDIEAHEVAGSDLPEVVAALRIVPLEQYGSAGSKILHVTLRASPSAADIHRRFCATFGVQGDPAEAKERFGCVLIDAAEYEGTMYGAVHFIKQSRWARLGVMSLERQEQRGEIPWGNAPEFAG
jgi:hypothetical protein